MISIDDPLDAVKRVDYELTVVRQARSLHHRDKDCWGRAALPNISVEIVRDHARGLTSFFSDLIVGKRYSETRTGPVEYSHFERVTIPYEGEVHVTPHGWWINAGALLFCSVYLMLTPDNFWDLAVAIQVLFSAVQLRRWRVLSAPFSGEVSKDVTFSGEIEVPYEEVWLIDPLLDEKLDLRSDRITKVYVAPVPSTLL